MLRDTEQRHRQHTAPAVLADHAEPVSRRDAERTGCGTSFLFRRLRLDEHRPNGVQNGAFPYACRAVHKRSAGMAAKQPMQALYCERPSQGNPGGIACLNAGADSMCCQVVHVHGRPRTVNSVLWLEYLVP